ncbi:MAG: hypothetical protein IJW82_08035 [Clostridia bacterium]|nr:hypothetical protein [Clostridia bacterium]
MAEIEVGFKIIQTQKEAEKILLDNGFINVFKTNTRDLYFGKNINFKNKNENEIKNSLIRCRNFSSFENLNLLNEDLPSKVDVDFETLLSYFNKLKSNGYELIFDTQKSDWIYKKGECWHQLQDIKYIGLLDYVYNTEIFDKGYTEEEQFEILKNQMKEYGFKLEYDLGVDKLRSLYNKKLMFSKNQFSKY